jgi:hypothetical protein
MKSNSNPANHPETAAQVTAKALGVRPTMRAWLAGHNKEAKRVVQRYLFQASRSVAGRVDLAFITPQTPEEWAYFAAKILKRLDNQGRVWLILPQNQGFLPRPSSEFWADYCQAVGDVPMHPTQTVALEEGLVALGFEPAAGP